MISENIKLLVAEFILARKNLEIKRARELYDLIDNHIHRDNLDPNEVFFYYGDPDNPQVRQEVYSKVQEKVDSVTA